MSPSVWPRPEEVRMAREEAGLTQTQAAELVHTGWQTWAKWETDATSDSARRMHPATWELFQVKLEIIKMLASGKLSAADVRKMKIYLPPTP
jgi:putative transcriptional regulator